MSSDNEQQKENKNKNIFQKYIWLISGLIVLIVSISFELFKSPEGDISNISTILGVISIFLIYLQRNFQITEELKCLSNALIVHENALSTHKKNMLVQFRSLRFLLEPGVLKSLLPHSQRHYDYLLKQSISLNEAKITSLISGVFYLSADTFEKYYFYKLLRSKDVEYYFSSAIIGSQDYFIRNNIEELANKYYYLANNKDVILLWFAKEMTKAEMESLQKRKDEIIKKSPKIQITISSYNDLIHYDSDLARDFGIAGNIAAAELIDGTEVEVKDENNKKKKMKLDDKYKLNFSTEFHREMLNIYLKQIEYLNKYQNENIKIPELELEKKQHV